MQLCNFSHILAIISEIIIKYLSLFTFPSLKLTKVTDKGERIILRNAEQIKIKNIKMAVFIFQKQSQHHEGNIFFFKVF